jgi:3-methyladenine DNA glycosylase/8-oxoguanine DNA glycosylase
VSQPSDRTLNLTVPVTQPYSAGPLLAYLRVRAIDGVERVERERYRRIVRIAGESRMLRVDFSQVDAGSVIVASCTPAHGLDAESVRRVVIGLTDADAPITAIEQQLNEDPVLVSLVRRNSGSRIPGSVDPFELTVRAILGQQVSVAAARTFAARLAANWGDEFDGGEPGFAFAFPRPVQLVDAPLEQAGLSKGRGGAIRELCEAVLSRRIDLHPGPGAEPIEESLLSIKGIGPWTAAYVALRGLRDRDAIPLRDLGLRQALGGGKGCSEKDLAIHAERWRPWRGYGAVHLWNTFLKP